MVQPDSSKTVGRPPTRGNALVRLCDLWVDPQWIPLILAEATRQQVTTSEIVRQMMEGKLTLTLPATPEGVSA